MKNAIELQKLSEHLACLYTLHPNMFSCEYELILEAGKQSESALLSACRQVFGVRMQEAFAWCMDTLVISCQLCTLEMSDAQTVEEKEELRREFRQLVAVQKALARLQKLAKPSFPVVEKRQKSAF